MPADVTWLVEKRVILITVAESITIEEVVKMNEDIIAHLEAGDEPVHVVFDAKHMRQFPSRISEVSAVMEYLKHPKLGWNMSVVPNRLVGFIGTVVNNMMRRKQFEYTDTLEEALEKIKRLDSSLSISAD